MHYYELLDLQARHVLSQAPALTYREAAHRAERELADAGITRETHRVVQPLRPEQAARQRADELLMAQARWERAENPTLSEAEAIAAADVSLRASLPEYAAIMGPRG